MFSRSRRPVIALATLVCLGATIVASLHFRIQDIYGLIQLGFTTIRRLGPVPFFIGMAVLPAFGFPLLAFSLSAGPVFAPRLGLPLVAGLVALSIVLNLTLTYWLGRYAFRPVLIRLLTRFGYRLPEVGAGDYRSLTVLVRVTPGPPFFVQSYLLALAGVPFGIYMWISAAIAGSYGVAVVFFGDSIANGKGKLAFLAFSLIVALSIGVHWLRKRYAKKKASPPATVAEVTQ